MADGINYGERILKCESCGGNLKIVENREILFCPFCGSSKLILESDDVKITRIQTNADVERAKLSHEVEMRKFNSEKDEMKFYIILISVFCLAMIIICALASLLR